jgi:hypothetical protein
MEDIASEIKSYSSVLSRAVPLPQEDETGRSREDKALLLSFAPSSTLTGVSDNALLTSESKQAAVAAIEIQRLNRQRKNVAPERQLDPELRDMFLEEVRLTFAEEGRESEFTQEVRDVALNWKAEGTIKKYTLQYKLWRSFCSNNGLSHIPAKPFDLALYLQLMAARNTTSSPTIARYSGIVFYHTVRGYPDPFTGVAKMVYESLKRQLGANKVQKFPILPSHMRSLYTRYILGGDAPLEDEIMYLGVRLSWEALLRFSDLQCVNYDCILIARDYMRIFVFDTKTSSDGKYVTIPTSKCPESAYQSMLRCLDKMQKDWKKISLARRRSVYEQKHGHSARSLTRDELDVLPLKDVFLLCPCGDLAHSKAEPVDFLSAQCGYEAYAKKLKQWLREIDLPAEYFGTHSARIGGATTLRLLGATQDTAKQLGFWKSDTVAEHYVSEIVKLPNRLEELRRVTQAGSYAYAAVEDEMRRSGRQGRDRT